MSDFQPCPIDLAASRQVCGATTSTAGKATIQFGTRPLIHIAKNAALFAPTTRTDINPDRMNPKTTAAKRAGII